MRTAEQEIADALERGDMGAVRYWQNVIDVVDAAPPFTPALIAQLQVLVRADPAPAQPTPIRRKSRTQTRETTAAPAVGTANAA